MNKKILFLVFLIFLCGCTPNSIDPSTESNESTEATEATEATDQSSSNQSIIDEAQLKRTKELEIARTQVIKKFREERDVTGTGRFIEDNFKKYSEDETISTIYYYDRVLNCMRIGENTKEYIQESVFFLSLISPDYDGEFKEEILLLANNILGEKWGALREKNIDSIEKFNNLTMPQKVAIKLFIEGKYDYYDEQEGGYAGDKYSNAIMEEASKKYDLTLWQVSAIWGDYTINKFM